MPLLLLHGVVPVQERRLLGELRHGEDVADVLKRAATPSAFVKFVRVWSMPSTICHNAEFVPGPAGEIGKAVKFVIEPAALTGGLNDRIGRIVGEHHDTAEHGRPRRQTAGGCG